MPPILWTGKLTSSMKLLVNANNLLAFITGNARDTAVMKQRMRFGYEGACSDHVTHYDELGSEHYTKIAKNLLEGIDLRGKEVLEVGCGTGIMSILIMQQGVAKLTCGDISEYMLNQCRKKMTAQGFKTEKFGFRQLDAEILPYDDEIFDIFVSGMLLGLVPNQQKVVSEMARVLRPEGILTFSTHASECWWETSDATFRAIPKRYVPGYRVKYWPRKGTEIERMLRQAGLVDVQIRKLFWQDILGTGGNAYDFFASVSAAWWNAKLPPHKVDNINEQIRDYFERYKVTQITQDIILAYGHKP